MSSLQDEVTTELQVKPSSIKKRRTARRFLLQALYAWELSQNNLAAIERDFLQNHNPKKFDLNYFSHMLAGIPQQQSQIKAMLEPYMHLPFNKLDPIERNILLIAGHEYIQFPSMPRPVIINEALELAKTFGAEESYKFINGVLDKLVKSLDQEAMTKKP